MQCNVGKKEQVQFMDQWKKSKGRRMIAFDLPFPYPLHGFDPAVFCSFKRLET